ncbi:hypothetical protein TNCV_2228871 [Trichonephila clavipes]|nr:hypothetical protein TNCV_2228871 [Trichonephila clavipes]
MAALWSYGGFQVMLGNPAMRKPSREPTKSPLDYQKSKRSIISTYIDKSTVLTIKPRTLESHRKPWPL